jgi:hypothetical protein
MSPYLCQNCGRYVGGKKSFRDMSFRLVAFTALLYIPMLLLAQTLFISIYGIALISMLFLAFLILAYKTTPERCPMCNMKLGKGQLAMMTRNAESPFRFQPISKEVSEN